jgi:hypothetical protein
MGHVDSASRAGIVAGDLLFLPELRLRGLQLQSKNLVFSLNAGREFFGLGDLQL